MAPRQSRDLPQVVFDEGSVMALSKPPGWIVDTSKSTKGKKVLEEWLFENGQYALAKSKEDRSGIVHRIDKETSGVLLVAKTKTALRSLQSQFKKREITKTYVSLVHGILSPEKGSVRFS